MQFGICPETYLVVAVLMYNFRSVSKVLELDIFFLIAKQHAPDP